MLSAHIKPGKNVFVRSNYNSQAYSSGGFMVEPVGGRDVLTPDSLDHDPGTREAAMSAYTQRPGQPVADCEYTTALEEILGTLGAAAVGRAFDALEAVSMVPVSKVSAELKSCAALAAARLYAAESMAFRTTGLALEMIGELDIENAVAAYPVEYAAVRRYAFEDLSACTDDLIDALRGANPYSRVVLRDVQPGCVVDRLWLAQQVLDACLQEPHDHTCVGVDTFPILIGRMAARGAGTAAAPDWIMGHEQVVTESAKVLACHLLSFIARERDAVDAGFLSQFLDYTVQLYALDSAVTRTVQLLNRRGIEKAKIHCDLASLLVAHTVTRLRVSGKQLLRRVMPGTPISYLVGELTTSDALDVDRANDRVFTHYVETSLELESPE